MIADSPQTMSTHAAIKLTAVFRRSREYQEMLWRQWPSPEQWPGKLDLCEAAAYLRSDYSSIWEAAQVGKDGRAKLPHQRIGAKYIFNKRDLDAYGRVSGREAA